MYERRYPVCTEEPVRVLVLTLAHCWHTLCHCCASPEQPAAKAGDEDARQKLDAERGRIESRLAEHSAESRRERRQRVSERAHAKGSVAIVAAAEAQIANERIRGRQRREK